MVRQGKLLGEGDGLCEGAALSDGAGPEISDEGLGDPLGLGVAGHQPSTGSAIVQRGVASKQAGRGIQLGADDGEGARVAQGG